MAKQDQMTKYPKRIIKAAITLYEDAHSGKTATLRYLYWLLTNSKPPQSSCLDFREKFDYTEETSGKSVIIALSTVGDSEEDVELNWMFFRSKWNKDFKKLGLKTIRRPCNDFASESGPVIVISPTHIDDDGARINDANIANLKKSLRQIHYIRKRKKGLNLDLSIPSIDKETWIILTNEETPTHGWGEAYARRAIKTALKMKEQIDAIIQQL